MTEVNNMQGKTTDVLLHVGFWLVYLVLNGIAWNAFDGEYLQSSLMGLLFLPVKILVVYLNFYWLMPAFLFKKHYLQYALLVVLIMMLGGVLQHVLYLMVSVSRPVAEAGSFGLLFIITQYVVPINSIVFFTAMIRILQQWYRQQNRAEALERARLGAELSFLKSQIHPHFLFNTLNNLYSLTLKQSEHAPRVVLKLSELLNYMLYEASGKEVLLSREILYLKNYVELEKIRYGNELEISLNAGEGVEGKKIEPMILLPFVENSFKHGSSQELSKPWITIDLKVKGDLLIFSVENSKVPGITLESKSGGIGLNNVRRRLELLYPGSYELLTTDHGDYFAVSLKLDLSKCTRYA